MGHVTGAIATVTGSGLAVAIASFLPPVAEWDVTTVGAIAFLCGVAGRVVSMAANFIVGKVEDSTTGKLEWPIDDAVWGERFALFGGLIGTIIALVVS